MCQKITIILQTKGHFNTCSRFFKKLKTKTKKTPTNQSKQNTNKQKTNKRTMTTTNLGICAVIDLRDRKDRHLGKKKI